MQCFNLYLDYPHISSNHLSPIQYLLISTKKLQISHSSNTRLKYVYTFKAVTLIGTRTPIKHLSIWHLTKQVCRYIIVNLCSTWYWGEYSAYCLTWQCCCLHDFIYQIQVKPLRSTCKTGITGQRASINLFQVNTAIINCPCNRCIRMALAVEFTCSVTKKEANAITYVPRSVCQCCNWKCHTKSSQRERMYRQNIITAESCL